MTIVEPKEFTLTSSVGEANRPGVEKGQEAIVMPSADESVKLKGSVSEVSAIPVGPAKFSLELEVAEQDFPEWLVAGMTGKAKVITYKAEKALTVPKSAVHTDEKNDEKKYVWLVKDGEPTRKTVSVGKTKGDKVEITKGLKEGDVVSLEKEADKKEDSEKSDKKEAKKEKDADKKEAKEKKESKEEEKADKEAEEKEKNKDVEDGKDGDEEEESESDDEDDQEKGDDDNA
jgi:multidrug efflux pump subunit AcrA (membrane-fusion protein)